MKIVHVAPNAPYNEGWGYQDNLLPKYQAKLGHQVTLIITNKINGKSGLEDVPDDDYISPDKFRVVRRKPFLDGRGILGTFFSRIKVYDLLKILNPDMIFYHGITGTTIFQITRYKRRVNPKVVVIQDNHLDYNIGFNPKDGITQRVNCLFYRLFYRLNDKTISHFYGVTPWRKQYGIEVCGVPKSKADVLMMGADDEKLDFTHRNEIRAEVRKQYNIQDSDFLIVSGGKLDENKNIICLMDAVRDMPGVRLLLFGSVLDDIKERFNSILDAAGNINYIGWVPSDKVYDYFFAADLVVFPGQHSVLWEQACASKVPCIFKKWTGMEHVNNGGNAKLFGKREIGNLSEEINKLVFTEEYYDMKRVAESEATDIYLYSRIAEKSLQR